MSRQDLIKEMKASVGVREPLVFFEKMADLFTVLFDKIDKLEADNARLKTLVPLAIQWEPRVAADMLTRQIESLKAADRDAYATEVLAFKKAYAEDVITQEYADFCRFWTDTLGWHPFLDYQK